MVFKEGEDKYDLMFFLAFNKKLEPVLLTIKDTKLKDKLKEFSLGSNQLKNLLLSDSLSKKLKSNQNTPKVIVKV